MFQKIMENVRQKQEEEEQRNKEEKSRLLSLSEKELLIEILQELKRIESRVDAVETSIILHN